MKSVVRFSKARWLLFAALMLLFVSSSWCQNVTDDLSDPEEDYCEGLNAGDVLVFVVETNGPRGVVIGFLALESLPAGLTLYLTDRPWDGTTFVDVPNDGEAILTIEEGQDINSPARFGYGESSFQVEWDGDALTLNQEFGDTLVLYCIDSMGSINPIVGFNNAGSWADANTTEFTESESILPDPFNTVGSVVLPHFDNYRYIGPIEGNKFQLQQFMSDPNNWNGTDSSFFTVTEEEVEVGRTNETDIVANPGVLDNILPVTAPPVGGPPADAPSTSDATPRILYSGGGWIAMVSGSLLFLV